MKEVVGIRREWFGVYSICRDWRERRSFAVLFYPVQQAPSSKPTRQKIWRKTYCSTMRIEITCSAYRRFYEDEKTTETPRKKKHGGRGCR